VLPLYIVEPGMWAQTDADARHYGLLREALVDLKDQLDRIGSASGDPRRAMAVTQCWKICAQHRGSPI
jgi:hypothetical protein